MSQFEDQIRFPYRNCKEGFQKSFENIGSYWRIPRPQPPLVHPRASLLFFSSRIWIYQAGTTYFGQHVITYRYLLSKVPNRCSSHAKETKYLPSIYVRSGRPWLWSHLPFWDPARHRKSDESSHGAITRLFTGKWWVQWDIWPLGFEETSDRTGLIGTALFHCKKLREDLGNSWWEWKAKKTKEIWNSEDQAGLNFFQQRSPMTLTGTLASGEGG